MIVSDVTASAYGHKCVSGSSSSFPFPGSFEMSGFIQSWFTDTVRCCKQFPWPTSAIHGKHCISGLILNWLSPLFIFKSPMLSVSVCWQGTTVQSLPMDRLAVERRSPSQAAPSATVIEESSPGLCPTCTSISARLVTTWAMLYIFITQLSVVV